MQYIRVREQYCVNCRLCEIHCLVAHSVSKDIHRAYKEESPRPLARIYVEEKRPVSLAVRCQHCVNAPCIAACLTGAMHRDPHTGAVICDPERCMGCWTCVLVCPYGAVFPDQARGIVVKCDLCPDREQPACVEACPNEALILEEVASE